MFSRRRAFLCFFILAALASLPAAAVAQLLDTIKTRGTIVVGVKTDYKPFGFIDASGNIAGLEIDLARDIAARLGVKLDLVPVIAANRMEYLARGRIDLILATMNDIEERREIVGIVQPDYYASGANILALRSDHLTDWPQLRGRRVCAIRGAYYNRTVAEQNSPELIVFPAVPEAIDALRAGKCTALLYDNTFIQSILTSGGSNWADYEMPLATRDEQGWAIAVPLTEADSAYDKKISEIVTDWHRTGELIALEAKWGLPPSRFLQEMHEKFK